MNIEQVQLNALLADAAYADILRDGDTGAVLEARLTERMTPTIANFIGQNFEVVSHAESDDVVASGFDATVWRGRDGTPYAGKIYVSMQGTEGLQDFLTDAKLALAGNAGQQVIDMVNWWLRITTPVGERARQIGHTVDAVTGFISTASDASGTGQIAAAELVNGIEVNGHSLGGYLASAFTHLLGAQAHVVHTTTFNSAGFAAGSESAFIGVARALGPGYGTNGFPAAGDPSQTNVFAEHGLNFTTNSLWFNQVGQRVQLFNENSTLQLPNHFMYKLTDALALSVAMERLDAGMTIDRANAIDEAGSNVVAGSLEGVLDSLRRLMLDPQTGALPIGDASNSAASRVAYHQALKQLEDSSVFTTLAGNVRIDLSKDLRAKARNDFSALASLITLSPVTLTGLDARLDAQLKGVWGSTYTDWTMDKGMAAADRAAGKETFTDRWIADRASMLEWTVIRNQQDVEFVGAGGRLPPVHFKDVDSGVEIDVGVPSVLSDRRQTIFGSSSADGLNGQALLDHLYGGAGADTLNGQGGNDYLEGNADNDKLDGGDGNDTLLGGTGNDSLIGGDHADSLLGGNGDDTLEGGLGNDQLNGGEGSDTYTFASGWGADTIEDKGGQGSIQVAGLGPVNGAGAAKVSDNAWQTADKQFNYTLAAIGPDRNDLIVSFSDRTDTIHIDNWHDGDLGITLAATVTPPVTNASYTGDFIKGLTPGAPTRYVFSDGNYVSAGVLANSADLITGSASADKIEGLGGNDGLAGLAGDDFIDGGAGDDLLLGGAGADTLNGGAGKDFIYGSGAGGLDYLAFTTSLAPQANGPEYTRGFAWVTYDAGIDANGLQTYDVLGADPSTIGSDAGNVIDGGAGDDWIRAGSGNDTVHGGDDNDQIDGLAGNDVVFGDAGNDNIFGDGLHLDGYVETVKGPQHGDDILVGGAGNDSLTGQGGDDDLYGGVGDDKLWGDDTSTKSTPLANHGDDYLDGGDGADQLSGEGRDDTLFGGIGNDTLFGDAETNKLAGQYHGTDYLDGEDGDDYLEGGGLADTLYGGKGADMLWGDASTSGLQGTEYGADYLDGEDGDDTLVGGGKDDSLFGGEGDDALVGDGELIAAADQGDDYLDGGAGNDLLDGDGGKDTLIGGDGDDQLRGGEGDDYLDGGEGKDTLDGGAGNDALVGGSGKDYLKGGDGADLLQGGDNDDTLLGGAGDDTLVGGSGADYLDGGEGNDTYIIGMGDTEENELGQSEVIADSSGNNIIVLADATLNATQLRTGAGGMLQLLFADWHSVILTNGAAGSSEYRFASGETLRTSELVGQLSDTVVQDTDAEGRVSVLGGRRGDSVSVLVGGARLSGGRGDDTLVGAGGNNTYHYGIGDGADLLTDSGSKIDAQGAPTLNKLVFGAGIAAADLRLGGAAGALTLKIGATAGNSITFGNFDQGSAAAQAPIDSFVFADGTTLTYAQLIARGFDGDGGNDTISGTVGGDRINGYEGNDSLSGQAGDDSLDGGSGNDLLDGGAGNDTLDGGFGDDTIAGGAGSDTYVFSAGSGLDVIDNRGSGLDQIDRLLLVGLTSADVSLSASGGDLLVKLRGSADQVRVVNHFQDGFALTRIEFDNGAIWSAADITANLVMSLTEGADNVLGTPGNDVYAALGGNDYVQGMAGNDVLYGGTGNDTLGGGDGQDSIFGGEGADSLTGDSGDDLLDGGAGNDLLSGGVGSDVYKFARGGGQDTVNNYDATVGAIDVVQFGSDVASTDVAVRRSGSNLVLQVNGTTDSLTLNSYLLNEGTSAYVMDQIRFADGTMWDVAAVKNKLMEGTGGNDTIYGFDNSADLINAGGGNDYVYGHAGADTLNGQDGYDYLAGEDGDDRLDGGPGMDTLYGGAGNDTLTNGEDMNGGDGNDTYTLGNWPINTNVKITETLTGIDELLMPVGILPNSVRISVSQNSSTLSYDDLALSSDSGTVFIAKYFYSQGGDYKVEQIRFADGTTWGFSDVLARVPWTTASQASDFINGFRWDETLSALGGDDSVDGRGGNDSIDGGAGNDSLKGNDGADTLDGGLGNDALDGGIGDDTFLLAGTGGRDTIVDALGNDRVLFGVDIAPSDVTLLRDGNDLLIAIGSTPAQTRVLGHFGGTGAIERMEFADGSVAWDATAILSRTVSGSANSMTGTASNDVFVVDNVGDSINEGADQGIDTVQTSVSFTLGANLENLTLTGYFDLRGSGNVVSNCIVGNSGNNTLDGGFNFSGIIELGNDTFVGGLGDDTYYLEGGESGPYGFDASQLDLVIENPDEGFDRIFLKRGPYSYVMPENVEALFVQDANRGWELAVSQESVPRRLTGDASNNIIDFNPSGAWGVIIDGGLGADLMRGGDGADTYVVDNAGDVVEERGTRTGSSGGGDTVESSVTFALGAGLEILKLTGSAAISGTGNGLNNLIDGSTNTAANILAGGLGDDTYRIGAGDTLVELLSEGTDTVEFNYRPADLTLRTAAFDGASIEFFRTTESIGGGLTLVGTAGDDKLQYGGFDRNQYNTITTGGTIIGGRGNDSLVGGKGDDTYFFDRGDGRDTITDFGSLSGNSLRFGTGISKADVILSRSALDLVVALQATSDQVTIKSFFAAANPSAYTTPLQTIRFADGSMWTLEQILFLVTSGGVDHAPTVAAPVEAQFIDEAATFNLTVPASTFADVDAGDSLMSSATLAGGAPLPEWLSYSPYDHRFYGTAPFGALGTTNVTLTATDILGASVSTSFSITVRAQDKTIIGTAASETLTGLSGNDTLIGLEGNDFLIGNAGDDVFDGGAGNEGLDGGLGNDTYLFGKGDGKDQIKEAPDATSGAVNVLRFKPGVLAAEITLQQVGANLWIWINGTQNMVVATSFFYGAAELATSGGDPTSSHNPLQRIEFADGVIWDLEKIRDVTANGNQNLAPIVAQPLADRAVAEGAALTFGFASDAFTDPNADSLYYYATLADGSGLPSWLVFDPSTRAFSATASMAGTTSVKVIGKDLQGLSVSDVFDIVVSPAAPRNLMGTAEADTLNGMSNNDTLSGLAGDDTLWGQAGDDWLDGGGGADSMFGGTGNDVYFVDSSGDIVTESASEGIDRVESSVSFALGSDIENLTLTGSSPINGSGNLLANILLGNAEANRLDGGQGIDSMVGGGGDDTYVVDDTADVVVEVTGGGNDSVEASASWTLSTELETLTLTGTSNIDGTGNALNNTLSGNAASNVLNGGEGHDTLSGGAGNDSLDGGSGNDVYLFGRGSGLDTIASVDLTLGKVDTLSMEPGIDTSDVLLSRDADDLLVAIRGSSDAVRIRNHFVSDAASGQQIDQIRFADGTTWNVADIQSRLLINHAPAMVSPLNNQTLTAGEVIGIVVPVGTFVDPDLADVLSYSATLADGTALPDWISFDSATRVFSGNSAVAAVGAISIKVTATDPYGFGASDVFDLTVVAPPSGNVIYGTEGDDYLYASGDDDTIYGRAGNDWVVGGSGNNVLYGEDGDDYVFGQGGIDTLIGGRGNDFYDVDGAEDTIVEMVDEGFDYVQAHVDYTIGANIEYLSLLDGATRGTGNALDNTIRASLLSFASFTLDGGAGADTLQGALGDDTYIVDNVGDLTIEYGSVSDGTATWTNTSVDTVEASVSYGLQTDIENLILTGSSAIDGMGNWLDNSITGNSAANRLEGGIGIDTLVGGLGDDTYVVDDTPDSIVENADGGIDTIESSVDWVLANEFENLTLTGAAVNATGNDVSNLLQGNAADNRLDGGLGADTMNGGLGDDQYLVDNDADVISEIAGEGNDSVVADVSYVLGANLEALTLAGTLAIDGTGNADANILTGNAAANTLTGGAGDDTLDGGAGNDVLDGGAGNDLYIVEGANDQVVEAVAEGQDTVQAAASYTLSDNVENLVLLGSSDTNGTGNASNNVIIGNDGDNVLDGRAGDDTLIGGLGNDTYVVDNTADIANEATAGGIDLVMAGASFTLGANLENLILTGAAAINATGNAAANALVGNSAANVLNGGGGADTLSGGLGDDTYVIDSANDVVIENASEGTDSIQSSVGVTLMANVENLSLTGAAAINATGNVLDNVLIGNTAANVINGAAGGDTMAGGTGNDTYVVDDSGDVVSENLNEGSDLVQSSVSFVLGANVENLTLTGAANLNGTGNGLANLLLGTAGDNMLDGSVGNDSMTGGAGNDTYVVDSAGDVVTEAAGAGADQILSSISLTLVANVENLTLIGLAALNATGNTLANTLTGNAGDNRIDGAAGADTLIGGAGNDTYVVDNVGDSILELTSGGMDAVESAITWTLGAELEKLTLTGSGNVNATGNALANALIGNAGINRLDGGTNADTMTGGAGNDTYVVDDIADVVVEAASGGADTVEASVNWTLGAELENLLLTGTADLAGAGNKLANTITGNAGNNALDGGAGADTLAGGAGDDTYSVDNLGDIVTEGTGAGTDLVKSSVTLTLAANVENLTLTGTAAINATGNSIANVLTGNAGANRIDGGAGADTMTGGAGDDTYVADNAGDVITELAGEGTDTVEASITWTLTTEVEKLTLTGTTNISATGNASANTLTGNAGSNRLDGGAGADTLTGGAGNDTYVVDNAADSVIEVTSGGTDVIESSINWTLGTDLENLLLTGTANTNGTGNTLANTLTGNAGNNVLDGGAGIDTLVGGAGDDTYVVDVAGDVVTEGAGAGTDLVQTSLSYTLGTNVENLTLTGTTAINGAGNTLDNALVGNSAVNTLTGGAGNDSLNGMAGADTMVGGAGNDNYFVDNAADVTTESASEGTDTVNSSVAWALGSNLENLTLTGTSAINGTGNTLANTVLGNAGNNVLTGDAGTDTLDGGAGTDTLIGGTGNDTYVLGRGYGADTVQENDTTAGNADVMQFLSGVTADQIWLRQLGNDLEVSIIGTADKATVQNWYLGSQYHVEQFKTSDGKTLLDSKVQHLVSAMASFAPPSMGQTTLPTNYQSTLLPVIATDWGP